MSNPERSQLLTVGYIKLAWNNFIQGLRAEPFAPTFLQEMRKGSRTWNYCRSCCTACLHFTTCDQRPLKAQNLPERGVFHKTFHQVFFQEFGQIWRDIEPLLGQFNSWLKQLGPRQLPVLSVQCLVAPQLSGNADPPAAWNVQVLNEQETQIPPSCIWMFHTGIHLS